MTYKIDLSTAAAALGAKGGQSTSEAKQAAARANGRRGGRPRKETKMCIISRDYTDHNDGLHIEKGTEVIVVDSVAKGDEKEWVEVIMPDGKHEVVLASAIS